MSSKPPIQAYQYDPSWIIYQDDDILVVNKPSGLLSVPGRNIDPSLCLVGCLPNDLSHALIVHRLDMDTSGIMVLAKHKEAHRALSSQFQNRQTQKEYRALVFGKPETRQGEIHLPMRCDWENRPKQMVDFKHGKQSTTLWEVTNHQTLISDSSINKTPTHIFEVKLTPVTGRSHQLRVHMQMLGHPILGDNLYADSYSLGLTSRLCLHASSLTLTHPSTLARLTFTQSINFAPYIIQQMA